MKNKNQKENWVERIKCKRENHENQLCGGCENCQRFWGLKSLIESILKSEKAKWEKKKIIIPKGKTHLIHDRCETCVEVGREEEREKLLEKIDEIIDDNNDLLRWQKEELKDEIKKD